MATLQTLPFDIAFEIASSAESLADLESLISTSRPCYNAFSVHRNSIICSVLLNELGPANYRQLLAIAQIPAGVSTMGVQGELFLDVWVPSSSSVLDFNPGKAIPAPLSKAETARLQRAFLRYELYSRLFHYEEVDKGYSTPVVKSGRIHGRPGRPVCGVIPRLSEHRLGKSNWCSRPDRPVSRNKTWDAVNSDAPAQFPTFVPPPCPLGGTDVSMESVLDFAAVLGSRGEPFETMERHRKAWREPFETMERHRKEWRDYNHSSKIKPEERMVPFDTPDADFPSLDFFDQSWQRYGMANFTNQLASLGLEFFSTLIDASTPKERRDKLHSLGTRNGDYAVFFRKRDFLPQALAHAPELEVRESRDGDNTEENICCDNEEEDPTRPNIGYREFLRVLRQSSRWNTDSYRYRGTISDDPFREYGCVFWDRARLVQFRRDLKRNPGYIVGGRHKIMNGPYRSRSIDRWRNKESMEARLMGILIQQSRWEELVDDFAWLA
ncbi:hypothetical protein QBC37DRAFT_407210 [Rhypophila decipiens]|uniref:Uncharacterized protein n=1 Tax=Rhypophila decipiens TaxID=261697 RepID=A0AAN7AYP8_9PEZI|nr:hypothetical protein QBC37DRAFT_407210 [Rhypophila decipiens]